MKKLIACLILLPFIAFFGAAIYAAGQEVFVFAAIFVVAAASISAVGWAVDTLIEGRRK